MQRWLSLIAAFLIAGCTAVSPAGAQGAPAADAPPLIAGRVALAEGDAQIWRVEEDTAGQWDGAEVNDVVSVGTGLYVGADGRSEVRVGPHTFRLGANSRGGFGQLDYSTAVFNLEYGTLNIRLASPEHGETTAVTVGDLRVELVAPGRYRIDSSDQGPMRVTVFEGHGTVRSASSPLGVSASQAIVVNPGGAGFNFEQPVTTPFDQWALSRDEQYRQVRSVQYVSPYMTGYEELDTYGEWTPDVSYGTVWYPRVVPVGWAPYRYGQWRWVRPWGWTWVDQAPWGYAPFHYGRWVVLGGRWAWVPGGYVRRPVWAPALVGFVGSNVSVSIGGPVVGWYPLAPWHRYEPHYRHNPTYVTVINQTIIQRPPPGVPRTINQGPGSTVVPGPRFREPIHKVVLGAQQKPEQLKPIAPPPLNVAPAPRPSTRKYAEHEGRPGPAMPAPPGRGVPAPQQPERGQPPQTQPPQPQPPQAGFPPMRVRPPMVADPAPGRGVAPQPPMPGNDPSPLEKPPGSKRGQLEPRPPVTSPAPPQERAAPPRPHLPSDQIPPGQAKPINPAEPPRFPPGAPPTIRQPPSTAPAARPVQPSAPPRAAPAPAAQPVPARPAPPVAAPSAPPVAAPAPAPQPRQHPPQSQKEQVLRNLPDQARGQPVEREAPPPRGKQIDR
jgi:hypothetical protein